MACLLAFGLEVVRYLIDAVGPFAGRQPEFDEAQPRAEGHETRILANLGHAVPEQESRAIAVGSHHVASGSLWTQAGTLDRPVSVLDHAQMGGVHQT